MSTTMSVTTKRNQSVIATSWSTAVQSDYIGRKNVIVTTQPRNTSRVWVAPSFERSNACPPSDSFKALGNNDHRFFSAPKGFKVEYLYYYTDSGTQYLDWEASDGSLEDLTPYDYDDLTRMEWLADGSYTERWEQGFRKKLYHGRTGAYYASESLANTPFRDWTLPPVLAGVNTTQIAPWNSAIDMTNVKGGAAAVALGSTTKDDIYIGFPKAHFRMIMRIDVLMPTLAHLGVADIVWFGFETNSAGGACAAGLMGANGGYGLEVIILDPVTGTTNGGYLVVTLAHTGVFSQYWLIWDFPYLTLLEYNAGAYTVLGQLVAGGGQPSKMIPMVCNESATNIITDFQVGQIQVWEIEPHTRGFYATAAANTQVQTVIMTEIGQKQLDLWIHSAGGNIGVGHTWTVEVSFDQVTWITVDSIVGIAATDQMKHYGETHLSATANLIVNPAVFPYVRVTLPALGAGVTGKITWALR